MAANMGEEEGDLLLNPGQGNPEFYYENINRPENHPQGRDYYVDSEHGRYRTLHMSAKPRFIYLTMTNEGVKEYNKPYEQGGDYTIGQEMGGCGWKFHVSIDDNDKNNIAAGWNIVKDILVAHNVFFSKVVACDYTMEHTLREDIGVQRGKQITIYMASHPNRTVERWRVLAADITRELANANIQPSYRPDAESDIPIQGSNYVSFTCDGIDGISMTRQDWQEEIATSAPDQERLQAFRAIALPAIEQPQIPEWHPPVVTLCPGCSTL